MTLRGQIAPRRARYALKVREILLKDRHPASFCRVIGSTKLLSHLNEELLHRLTRLSQIIVDPASRLQDHTHMLSLEVTDESNAEAPASRKLAEALQETLKPEANEEPAH